jgi:transcriptional regulator with XRE-family HTH domain
MQVSFSPQLRGNVVGYRTESMEPSGPESTKAIGERLRLTRLALNFRTQAAICRKISEDKNFAQVWNNWEKGRDRINVDNAILLCQKFRLTLDWIYRGDNGMLPAALATRIEEVAKADKKKAS